MFVMNFEFGLTNTSSERMCNDRSTYEEKDQMWSGRVHASRDSIACCANSQIAHVDARRCLYLSVQ